MRSISKSLFLNARVDPRLAWFRVHTPDDFDPPSEVVRARMEEGIRVGEIARQLRPGGVLVGQGARDELVAETDHLLAQGAPIYEAALEDGGMFCRVDILAPLGDGWELVEVKSGASVSERHRWDLAFQVAAARAAGLRVERAVLLHVHTEYVRGEKLDPQALFREVELTHELDPELAALPGELEAVRTAVEGPRPRVTLLEALQSGGDWPRSVKPSLPEHHVTELYWSNGQDWMRRGIEDIRDIPDPTALTRAQRIQLEAVRSGLPQVDPEPLREWLRRLRYPLYHLDFETVSPAVPLFPGTRPYQQIPFQFSLHIEHEDGQVEHVSYLHDHLSDPRPSLIRALGAIQGEGSVTAHHAGFERRVLRELLKFSPGETWLADAAERLVDTLTPFQRFWYHHPAQRGSCSLKRVLPALTGLGYDGMEVADGAEAGVGFLRMARGEVTGEERARLRRALERYCEMDTRGMMEVVGVLREAAGRG
jgi:hypothetical protein